MKFKKLKIYVSYRIDAGAERPNWRALRAQVKDESGKCGSDLTYQGIKDVDTLIAVALNNLNGAAEEYLIEFSPRLKIEGCRDKVYGKDGFVRYVTAA